MGARACRRACVSQLDAEILSASVFFSPALTHHGSIVLGFPANHMSGLLCPCPLPSVSVGSEWITAAKLVTTNAHIIISKGWNQLGLKNLCMSGRYF